MRTQLVSSVPESTGALPWLQFGAVERRQARQDFQKEGCMTKELASAVFSLNLLWSACEHGPSPCLAILRLLNADATPDPIWRQAAEQIGITEALVRARMEAR